MEPKLNSSVSVVPLNNNIIEFFKTNTRESIKLKTDPDLMLKVISNLNGFNTIDQIAEKSDISKESLSPLLSFLSEKGILSNLDPIEDFKGYLNFRRVINFLSDYSKSHEHLVQMWNNILNAKVLIIGMGAVGTWVVSNLVQSGVRNIVIMDNDIIEVSNIHRQFGYTEADIGYKKIDVIGKRLKEYVSDINVEKIDLLLNKTSLESINIKDIDLIINCADKPNVDTTSLYVGEYCMKHKIPHIIGGGYNLHLSLIGQTIIPGETACVNCFKSQLEKENNIDSDRVKKLVLRNRKVGSIGPMCSIIASMIGMEGIKILSKEILPSNINKRGEFDINTMDIKYKTFNKLKDCEWCGEKGIYNY